jgi:hypothetical protein
MIRERNSAFGLTFLLICLLTLPARSRDDSSLVEGDLRAAISTTQTGGLRAYTLTSNAELRDNLPADKRVEFRESPQHPRLRTGNLLFDGLYALAVHEALQSSVSQIRDGSYGHGEPLALRAFETGRLWNYVWTRDLSYAAHLGLAGFDPERAAGSLLFKASVLKPSVSGGFPHQIIQDTGSGGSYPVSTDRVVWAMGASEVLKYLRDSRRHGFLRQIYPFLRDTLEQDRRLVFDPADGLYRGEQSFLDWREQTYPLWTKENVLPIAMSKTLSVNAANHFALRTAAEWAGKLGRAAEQKRYAQWASQLKLVIDRRFWDADAGLYSTYLLADEGSEVRAHRYDLLGECLAVLLGVAPDARAREIIGRYPTGRYGPPVVWPQERTLPIYHNHAIWPFATAYWIKAARRVNNAEAVDHGVTSLMRGAAFNLSNMENLDVGTGRAWAGNGPLQGPVINSQRQLWSVAGYLSMVQDVVFGLETSWDGIRFLPFVTARLRGETFAEAGVIELRDFDYRGKTITVRVHLPAKATGEGACRIARIALNGKQIGSGFVAAATLPARSAWDIFLAEPKAGTKGRATLRGFDERALFSPGQPEWEDVGQRGITLENGLPTLHFRHADVAGVTFNIYRDGQLSAKGVRATPWTDRRGKAGAMHFYAIEAIDQKTGNASHLTPTRSRKAEQDERIIGAKQLENRGGSLIEGHHFENWGQAGHDLRLSRFGVGRSGRYLIRVAYSNGAGPISSGITCAVKKLEIRRAGSGTPVAGGYLVMPHSGDWKRFDFSSSVRADLKAGEKYALRIREDEYSRNMSYLGNNRRYTAASGGGDAPYNYVNIAAVHLLRVTN